LNIQTETIQPQTISWPDTLPGEQWIIYDRVLSEAEAAGIPFALGGAVALGAYTGTWRNTKDMDLYILPRDRERMIAALTRAGLDDLYPEAPYDPKWIYRGHVDDCIVDTIWAMANGRAEVDEQWLTRGPQLNAHGHVCPVLPPEELMWSKMYVLQRDRCDWPDIINLIHATGPSLDWNHLTKRLEDDVPLLTGILAVFAWICPSRSTGLPKEIWRRARATLHPKDTGSHAGHENLLDSRPWFRHVRAEEQFFGREQFLNGSQKRCL
jgi:hypothetical protein